MIKTFKCKKTAKLFDDVFIKEFSSFQQQGRRKLLMLNSAKILKDLEIPPGNKLEKLAGDRNGQYSIRINDQWRVCFEWVMDTQQMLKLLIIIRSHKNEKT
jgi:proteic killer suppression protein